MQQATRTRHSPAIADRLWRMVPGPLRKLVRTQGGRRLVRFAPAAVLALCATQLTYFVFQLLHVTYGIAGAAGWLAGAVVSYVVSRWAWERKGRPHLLKETLPFAVISVCVGFCLTEASKFAGHEVKVLGLHGAEKVIFAQGVYLAANCVTFVIRFLIFHYLLFADRGSGASRPLRSGSASAPDGVAGPRPGAVAVAPAAAEPGTTRTSRARRLRSRIQVPKTTLTKLSA
jgi:putative flippase GtrA